MLVAMALEMTSRLGPDYYSYQRRHHKCYNMSGQHRIYRPTVNFLNVYDRLNRLILLLTDPSIVLTHQFCFSTSFPLPNGGGFEAYVVQPNDLCRRL